MSEVTMPTGPQPTVPIVPEKQKPNQTVLLSKVRCPHVISYAMR